MRVEDLDILKPEKRIMRIGGNDIDVSFIPCAITFDIDKITQELFAIDQKKIESNGAETKRAFDLSIELASVFCEWKYPEMTKEWFMENCDVYQIQQFTTAITQTLQRIYNNIQGEAQLKNVKAPRKRKSQ